MTYRNPVNNPGSTARAVTLSSISDSGTYFNTTALSLASTVTVTPVNDAPVLAPFAPALPTISEDATNNGGQTVAALIGGSMTDPDTGALAGIAIFATGGTTGTWQYSTDAGNTWSAVGPVSAAGALLLRSADKIRCVPDTIHAGSATFSYRAWDQTGTTSGQQGAKVAATTTGGTSPFSSADDAASITINSAPPTTYADWAVDSFSADELAWAEISGTQADPEGAGLSNFLRYAFDLPAHGPAKAPTMVAYDGAAATPLLNLTFTIRSHATDLTYSVQASTDLTNWTTLSTYSATGVKQTVTHAAPVPPGAARYFVRLQVQP
jgi:hypothetical protein